MCGEKIPLSAATSNVTVVVLDESTGAAVVDALVVVTAVEGDASPTPGAPFFFEASDAAGRVVIDDTYAHGTDIQVKGAENIGKSVPGPGYSI